MQATRSEEHHYGNMDGNMGCRVFKEEYEIRKVFGQKSLSQKDIIVFLEFSEKFESDNIFLLIRKFPSFEKTLVNFSRALVN